VLLALALPRVAYGDSLSETRFSEAASADLIEPSSDRTNLVAVLAGSEQEAIGDELNEDEGFEATTLIRISSAAGVLALLIAVIAAVRSRSKN